MFNLNATKEAWGSAQKGKRYNKNTFFRGRLWGLHRNKPLAECLLNPKREGMGVTKTLSYGVWRSHFHRKYRPYLRPNSPTKTFHYLKETLRQPGEATKIETSLW